VVVIGVEKREGSKWEAVELVGMWMTPASRGPAPVGLFFLRACL
jgi:hypothetical protein